MPDLSREARLGRLVAGVDEAGRGPLAGPVVAAAVIFAPGRLPTELDGLDDSKRLSAAARIRYAAVIGRVARVGIGAAGVAEIDRLNILRASLLAMERAVAALGLVPDAALVDGTHAPLLSCPVQTLIDGDTLSLSIAAASVIAKVVRDRAMKALGRRYDAYGWERNAGYPTREHREALLRCGVTPHHRRSFAPVRALLLHVAASESNRAVRGDR
jgi:ribonuclease HII